MTVDTAPAVWNPPLSVPSGLRVASVDIVRRGALPPAALTGLRATATQAVEERHAAVIAALNAAAEELEAALHAAVPQVDAPVRRSLLKLKRAVHNRRPLPVVDPPPSGPAGAGPLPGLLSRYAAAVAAREALAEAGSQAEDQDRQAASGTLQALLADPAVRRGLAATAPEVAAELERASATASLVDPRSSLARTVVGYLTRIALKPSPASAFAAVDFAVPVELAAAGGPADAPRADVRVAPALAYALLLSCASDPAFADLVELAPAEALPGGRVLLGERLDIDGYLFRHDEPSTPLEGPCLEAAVALGRAPAAAHRAAQQALDPRADAAAGLDRLLRAGTVQVVLPWADHDQRHAVLAGLCRSAADADPERRDQLQGWAELLDRVHATSEVLVRADHERAVGLLATLRRDARRLGELGAAAVGVRVSEPALVHETVGGRLLTSSTAADQQARVRALDEALDRTLRPRLVRSRAHSGLADFVADRLAPGARVSFTQVLDLLGGAEEIDHHLGRWALQDVRAADGDPTGVPGVLAPSVSAHLQRAGDLTVLNAALPGAAAAALRHLPVLGRAEEPARAAVEGELDRWLRALSPGGRWYALASAEEWTDLQGAPFLDLPRLRWPADPPRVARSSGPRATRRPGPALADLWLAHQPESRTLRLEDPVGQPLALVPVGVISPFLVSGPLRALLIAADPWLLQPSSRRPDHRRDLADGPVAGAGRVTDGPLVVHRATWWVPASTFPRSDRTEPSRDYLRRVQAWRRARDLPDEVFVRADTGPTELNPRLRKPQWVRWDVPHTLALAARLADRASRLVLTEALPAADGAAGPCTETVRFLGWPGESLTTRNRP